MGGKSRICEICGVRERHRPGFFANFPKDELRCRRWVQIVGKEDLVHIPIEKLHEVRFICGDHFEKRDFNKKGSRLKKRAYPKLKLSAPPLTDQQLIEFPLHVASKSAMALIEPVASTNQTPLAMTSTQSILAPTPICMDVVAPEEPMASTSKTQLATSTIQNIDAQTSMCMEVVASTSRMLRATSTAQIITAPTPNYMKVEESVVEPLASTSKTPFATSTTCNIRVPSTSTSQTESLTRKRKSTTDIDADASPKKRKLLQQLQSTKCKLASLKKSAKLIESLESTVLKELIESAIKNQKRKPQGKRYTTNQKISALAIYKRLPKTYRYLQHLVPLPGIKTLNCVLKKIPMEPGINQSVLEHLKNISANRELKNRICVLSFDEMSLKPRLVYDIASDKVEGFQDLGDSFDDKRSEALADHALVLLLQGLHQKFKQPLAYYFVKGTISSAKLSVIIKDAIKAVRTTGFDIVATVCDQGPTNMGALKILKTGHASTTNEQENENSFIVESKKVWILYDIPHLFKSIRNNFLNCGEMSLNGKNAKWCHMVKVHEKNKTLLYLSKVTENHVAPSFRAKMKVKFAAQMLSTTVSAVLKLLAEAEADPEKSFEIMDTALVVQELDRLFDCTNGPSSNDDRKSGIRENVSVKTNHLQIWADFRKKLSAMRFVKNGQVNKNVKCVNGYLTSLSSLQDLWHHVHDIGFKYLNLRQLNQDALENLFGLIRQHSPTNKNPTATGFIGALKTSIVSGMTAPHSRGSNCQKDNKTLLTDFRHLVFGQQCETNKENEVVMQEPEVLEENIPVLHIEDDIDYHEITEELLSNVDNQACVYVSGYIASLLIKNNHCCICKDALVAENHDSTVYAYIQLREWWPERTSLTYPSLNLCKLIEQACDVFEKEIIPRLHEKNICQLCVTVFQLNCNAKWLTCQQHAHDILNALYIRLARLLIRRQCNRINQKFSQREEMLAASCKKAQQQGTAK